MLTENGLVSVKRADEMVRKNQDGDVAMIVVRTKPGYE